MQACAFRGVSIQAPVSISSTRPVSRAFAPAIECKASSRRASAQARHKRIRRKLTGTEERPRLAVFRSNENIYAQVIDDSKGMTLAAAATTSKELKELINENGANMAAAEAVGKKIAELCSAKNITKVAFDRGGNIYHGRVKALADAARAGGLQF